MVYCVESDLRDERLSSINPYFPREQGGCVYPYFFTMQVEGKYILDTIDEMYQNMDIQEFMKKSYEYCVAHAAEIRKHIRESEH